MCGPRVDIGQRGGDFCGPGTEEVVAWSGAVVSEGEKRRLMGVNSLLPLLSPARLVMIGCHVKTEPQV